MSSPALSLAAIVSFFAKAIATELKADLGPDPGELIIEPYGLPKNTAVQARKSGLLKATKRGRSYYATRADLAAYLAISADAPKPARDAKHAPANEGSIVADLYAARARKAARK